MSGATKDDVYRLIGFVQDDLRKTQARLVEIRSMLAAGAMEREPADVTCCPKCRVQLGGARTLAEHLANVHDGPAVPMSKVEVAG